MRFIILTNKEIQQLEQGDDQLWVAYVKIKRQMNTKSRISGKEYPITYEWLAQQLSQGSRQGKSGLAVSKERARYLFQKMEELGLVKRYKAKSSQRLLLHHLLAETSPQSLVVNNSIKKNNTATNHTTEATLLEKTTQNLFTYWQQVHEHPDAKLTPQVQKVLRYALREGYSVTQCQQAIDGCRRSTFHRGNNPQGVRYDSLTLIFRDREHIEQFIQLNQPRPLPASTNKPSKKSQRTGLDVLIEAFDAHYGERLGRSNPFTPSSATDPSQTVVVEATAEKKANRVTKNALPNPSFNGKSLL